MTRNLDIHSYCTGQSSDMIKAYVPAETGVFLLNGSLDLGRCKVFPEKVDAIKPEEGTRVWFEIPEDADDEEDARAKAVEKFYEYCALLSFFTRYPFSEKRHYGFSYSYGGSSYTTKPPNLIEESCTTTKILRPWKDEYWMTGDHILIPEDTKTLFDTYYKFNEDERQRFLKIIFCYWFGRLTQDRFPLASTASYVACLDESAEYDSRVENERGQKMNRRWSIEQFLRTHCSINGWETTFKESWTVRNKFIHGAELGFKEYVLQDPMIKISRIKKRIQPLAEPYTFLVRAIEPIVNSSIIDWVMEKGNVTPSADARS